MFVLGLTEIRAICLIKQSTVESFHSSFVILLSYEFKALFEFNKSRS